MASDTVEFENVECTAETDAAILCVIDGAKHWIPKKFVDDDSEVYKKGTNGKLVISEWIATQKNLV